MILGVEVALDDDVEIRDAQSLARVNRKSTIKGVDVAVGELLMVDG